MGRNMLDGRRSLPFVLQWTAQGRFLTFLLAAASIWCLLLEMYGICSMRAFAIFILIPATITLYAIAWINHQAGDRRLARAIVTGTFAGLVGAVAYDLFRLPFVCSQQWGLESIVPQMHLFKVFPRFGAILLGQPLEQPSYSWAAHLLGWAYHFSNGATFGVMFTILVGQRLNLRKTVAGAVALAVAIELLMLVSPYTRFFDIHLTSCFVVVTLSAHIVFGLFLGLYVTWHATFFPVRRESLG